MRQLTDLLVRRLEDGRRRLEAPLEYDLGFHMKGALVALDSDDFKSGVFSRLIEGKPRTVIVVPAGFETDFSSVPAILDGIYNWSDIDVAGVVHDYLYHLGFPRKTADSVWYKIAKANIGTIRAWLGYVALRVGGRSHWNGK